MNAHPMTHPFRRSRCLAAALLYAAVAWPQGAAIAWPVNLFAGIGKPFRLAEDGAARAPIIVSPEAGDASRAAASRLAEFLERITGAAFAVEPGDGTCGIALGTAAEFPALAARLGVTLRSGDHPPTALQRYRLRSHRRGVQVIGASELAVEYAVWDLLNELGFRQFFPGPLWEIIPSNRNADIAADRLEAPDYYDRRIVFGTIEGDPVHAAEWMLRNRLSWHGGPPAYPFRPEMPRRYLRTWIHATHAYSYIVRDHRTTFDQHPEWLALVDGARGRSTFFCISNPELRAFIAQCAVDYFERYPESWSFSLEPTDGARICECKTCAELAKGKTSNLVVLLANEAAEAIEKHFPNEPKYVGLLGYGFHWQPPDLRLHDRVVTLITTQTLCPGEGNNPPMDERLQGWADQAANVGVYVYQALLGWGGWLPGVAAGANPAHLADIAPRYHAMGARVWLAEASNVWGPCGLGYYLTSRLLWDVSASGRAEAIIDDFLARSFGPARESMRAFFDAVDSRHGVAPGNFNHLQVRVTRMMPPLLRALEQADNPAARIRVEHFLLYARLIELNARLLRLAQQREIGIAGATPETVHQAAADTVRLAWQTRHTNLFDWRLLYGGWSRAYGLKVADLAAPGEPTPPELTPDDIRTLVAETIRRYGTGDRAGNAEPPPGGRGPTVRNGQDVLFDAGGFDGDDPLAAFTVSTTTPDGARIVGTPASETDSGPAGGAGYLRLERQTGDTSIHADFNLQAEGRVEVEWMAHGDPRGDTDHSMNYSVAQGSRSRIGLITRGTGNVFVSRAGQWEDTGLTYDGTRWQRWRLRYAPGSETFELTIGDQTRAGLPVSTPGPVDRFTFRCGHNHTLFFVDGVPSTK